MNSETLQRAREQSLQALCDPYGFNDRFNHLECDGLSRVLSYVLDQAMVRHTLWGGLVRKKTDRVPDFPHVWIEADGWLVDYRLRVWFGPNVPHGVIAATTTPMHYLPISELPHISRALFEFLCEKWP